MGKRYGHRRTARSWRETEGATGVKLNKDNPPKNAEEAWNNYQNELVRLGMSKADTLKMKSTFLAGLHMALSMIGYQQLATLPIWVNKQFDYCEELVIHKIFSK
jgi:hypothetical protein